MQIPLFGPGAGPFTVFDLWRTTMIPKFRSLARSGLLALGVIGGVSIPAFAAPIGPTETGLNANLNDSARQEPGNVILARDRVYAGRSYRNWNNGGRYWRRPHGNYYRPYRNYNRPYYNNYYRFRPSISFGIGIPLYGFGGPDYSYGPSYYAPRYYQPRVYRSPGYGNSHEAWCYNRYRSYRAYDNTFQPYYGPRRQCWSPYGR